MKFTGKLLKIRPSETFGSFTKQTVWLQEIVGEYPNTFSIDMSGKALEFMSNFKEGEIVEIEANVRGRWYSKNGKEGVFNSLAGWKIQKLGSTPSPQANNGGHPDGFKPVGQVDYNDDLPF